MIISTGRVFPFKNALPESIVSSSSSSSYSPYSFPFKCVDSFFLFVFLSRPYRTDLPACVLVVSRFVTTDFRTTVNTCMLQSRGGARTSKRLLHRFLIERKESIYPRRFTSILPDRPVGHLVSLPSSRSRLNRKLCIFIVCMK